LKQAGAPSQMAAIRACRHRLYWSLLMHVPMVIVSRWRIQSAVTPVRRITFEYLAISDLI
jgi:hypothetical protein